jgi:hypothetical protein
MSNEDTSAIIIPQSPLQKKAIAKAMFTAGHQPKEIAEALGITHPEQISNWARKDDWYTDRALILEKTTGDRLREILASQERTLNEIQEIKDKSMDSIINGSVAPAKFSEASSSYLAALEMERKIKIEALQLSFINDVATILREEVADPLPGAQALLIKISQRFRTLFNSYRQTSKPIIGEPNAQ